MPQNSDADVSRLMKERKCYKCKIKEHIIFNCSEKVKVSIVSNTSNINNIEDID